MAEPRLALIDLSFKAGRLRLRGALQPPWMLPACVSSHPPSRSLCRFLFVVFRCRGEILPTLGSAARVLSRVDWFHLQLQAGVDRANARLDSPATEHLCDPISGSGGKPTLTKIPASSFVGRPYLSGCSETRDVSEDKHRQTKCDFRFNSRTFAAAKSKMQKGPPKAAALH